MSARLEVFIPAYHPADLVDKCLQSVAAQTLPLYAVTVVDDASPYDLSALVRKYPEVRFIRNEANLGIGGNLNRCVQLAGGDYLAFLHSDDMLVPTWHEVWQKQLAEAPADVDLFLSGVYFIDAQETILTAVDFCRKAWTAGFPENMRRLWDLCFYGVPFSAAVVYRRSVFERYGLFPCDRYPHNSDVDLNMRILMEGRIRVIPERLSLLRRHAGQSGCQSAIEAARTAASIFHDLDLRYRALLTKTGFNLLREPLTVYLFIAYVQLLHGQTVAWKAYRQLALSGNPYGFLNPWTWLFGCRLAVEYASRIRKAKTEKRPLL